MDYNNIGGWSFDGVCRGIVYPPADSCYMGYDEHECYDNKCNDEYCLWFESRVGGGCYDCCYFSCCMVFVEVYSYGFRVMK